MTDPVTALMTVVLEPGDCSLAAAAEQLGVHPSDLDPDFGRAAGTLVRVMAYAGRFDDAMRVAATYIARSPGEWRCASR